MPRWHCTILALIFTRRQVLWNRQQMPEIGGKSVLVHASDSQAVWIIKDVIWENRRCPWNIRHAKYLDLSAIHNPAVWNEFWLKHTSAMTYSQATYRAAGSSGRTFFIIIKQLAMYKQRGNISKFLH